MQLSKAVFNEVARTAFTPTHRDSVRLECIGLDLDGDRHPGVLWYDGRSLAFARFDGQRWTTKQTAGVAARDPFARYDGGWRLLWSEDGEVYMSIDGGTPANVSRTTANSVTPFYAAGTIFWSEDGDIVAKRSSSNPVKISSSPWAVSKYPQGFIGSASDTLLAWIETDTSDGETGVIALIRGDYMKGGPAALGPVDNWISVQLSSNPLQSEGTFRVILPCDSRTDIVLYDVSGRAVKKLAQGMLSQGAHQFSLGGLAPGIYFLRVKAGRLSALRKLAVVR